MTVRDDITVDFSVSPRIITVAAPSAELTIQDLHDTLRTIEARPQNMDDPKLISSAGKEVLSEDPILQVGVTSTLQNAKLAFEAREETPYVQCTVSGGNLVAVDEDGNMIDPIEPTAFTQVVIAQSSAATLTGIDPDDIAEILRTVKDNQGLIVAG